MVCVMLFIALVPLAVHVFSITNFSEFIMNNDRQNKESVLRSVIINTSTTMQQNGSILIADIIAGEEGFATAINDGDFDSYFTDVMQQTYVTKNTLSVTGLMIADKDGKFLGGFGYDEFQSGIIEGVINNHFSADTGDSHQPNGTYRPNLNLEPMYVMVYPLETTDYELSLIIISSVWDSMVGISSYIQADVEIKGENEELFYAEKLIRTDENENPEITEDIIAEPIVVTIPYNGGSNFINVYAYGGDEQVLLRSDNLKFVSILVAVGCIVAVWIIGTYILNHNLFNRIEYFSEAMRKLSKGEQIAPVEVSDSNEFARLTRELRRVIAYNEERTRIKEELEIAIKRAEVANTAKSDFLANMSHELRTPLNAIIGFSEILSSKELDGYSRNKTREYAKDIHDSGRHLLSIINDILDLSKVEAGKMRFAEGDVDLIETAEASIRLITNQANAKDISVTLNTEGELPLIHGDERMVQQIMTNLLSNAVKFSLALGQIIVTIKQDDNGDMVFAVKDNGIGIAEDKLKDVMEPFHQVETSYDRSEVGTGLGLSLVKAFVELHDGSINLESELGNYTVVTIKFPASRVIDQEQDVIKAKAV